MRIDFAYPSERVAIELDARRWHSSLADVDRDRSEANLLAALGWRLLRFDWSDVHDRSAYVAATVAELLETERA